MEEKKSFVENSKVAFKGTINGIVGSIVYELILSILVSIFVTMFVGANNSGATSEELSKISNDIFDKYPIGLVISCLVSLLTLGVFVYLIKWDKFKELIKNSFNNKTLKYGFAGVLCIMAFSIIYNSSITELFKLGDSGNSNQENVVALIKDNMLFGFLSVVILAPVVEELTYRYCLFGGVYKKKRWLAYLVAGFVFMFMHSLSSFFTYGFTKELLTEFLYLPPYLFSGLVLCYIYDKSDSLGASTLAHLLNNLVSFLAIVSL